jgi:hypothetical protein
MTESEMTTEDLVDYAVDLLASMDDSEIAEVEGTYGFAIQIARLVADEIITADGVTNLGHDHLFDLWNDLENDGQA